MFDEFPRRYVIMVLKEDLRHARDDCSFPGERSDVVSRTVLAMAIQRSFMMRNTEENLEKDVAEEMAQHVLNFFGFGERIIDNMLKTDDRDIFYMLEDLGILKTEREETTLYDGREWRINYWTLKKNYIANLMSGSGFHDGCGGGNPDTMDPYEDLPDDIWSRE